jgi:polar amino acid transport system ATP-binding protein
MNEENGVPPQTMIMARDVRKAFGHLQVLKGMTFEVQRGETAVFIGRSGSGKSTMLRCLNLLEEWTGGDIFVRGKALGYDRRPDGRVVRWNGRQQARARMDIGMVFQQFNLFPHMNVLQNVMVGPLKIRGVERQKATEMALDLLSQVGLADKRDQYPTRLSGGQQQRVAIARALAMKPDVLLLDEITSALDPELVGEVLDVVADLKSRGLTMVFVTHEIQFAHDVADKVFFIEDGQIAEEGPPGETLENPKTEALQRFLSRFRAGRHLEPTSRHESRLMESLPPGPRRGDVRET